MAVCWVILRGQQIYTVIQAVHSLLYIVAKWHFFSIVTWKYIIKYLQKCEGCTHFCEIYLRNTFSKSKIHILMEKHQTVQSLAKPKDSCNVWMFNFKIIFLINNLYIMNLIFTILIIACVLFYSLLFFITMPLPINKLISSIYDATTLKAKA